MSIKLREQRQKGRDGSTPVSGSRESISALPAPSEPYVRVSPHTAQASASIIEASRGTRPGRHDRRTEDRGGGCDDGITAVERDLAADILEGSEASGRLSEEALLDLLRA